jgi:hypothetical protein
MNGRGTEVKRIDSRGQKKECRACGDAALYRASRESSNGGGTSIFVSVVFDLSVTRSAALQLLQSSASLALESAFVFSESQKGAANNSPPHFRRVCKFNGLKGLGGNAQLLSQAGSLIKTHFLEVEPKCTPICPPQSM